MILANLSEQKAQVQGRGPVASKMLHPIDIDGVELDLILPWFRSLQRIY